MASFRKRGKVWGVQLCVLGVRDSGSFPTKVEAEHWAAERTKQIKALKKNGGAELKTLRDLIEKYAECVTPTKRGARWESVRLNAWLSSDDHKLLPLEKLLSEIGPDDFSAWRDQRIASGRGSNTVIRELSIASAVMEYGRRELRWIAANPILDVRRPRTPDHRTRVISDAEVAAVVAQLGYTEEAPVTTSSQAVAAGFLLALRTGMRCGEVFSLKWEHVHDDFVHLPSTKTVPRSVPLDPEAKRLIERMRSRDSTEVFAVPVKSVDALFRRARAAAGLSGFTFHDSRRTAATRLSKRVDVLMLCRIMGWKETTQALTYYAPTIQDMTKLIS